jgi:hypothetical protein
MKFYDIVTNKEYEGKPQKFQFGLALYHGFRMALSTEQREKFYRYIVEEQRKAGVTWYHPESYGHRPADALKEKYTGNVEQKKYPIEDSPCTC